jgi:hypothetical protein
MKSQVSKNADFRQEQGAKLDRTITDLNGKLNLLKQSSSQSQDLLVRLRSATEITTASVEKHERTLENLVGNLERVSKECERLHIIKQDEKVFQELRKDVIAKVNKSLARIEDVNNKIEATDNYLARYLPFNSFC